MMMQTAAIFKDAYRELNHKKLFWIVMGLSIAVVASFALLGNNEKGMTVAGYTLEIPFLSTKAVSKAGFYKFIFSGIGVKFWLTWGAAILALVSTAGMIPDFVASGSIDMSLAKPIGRVRLFLTKYATGLLFVALQVIIFSIGAFLIIGIRGKAWEPSVFLAVPLVVAFYSYLYCVCALVGLITRSGITALLLTIFFWLAIWGISTTETQLLTFRLQAQREVERTGTQVKMVEDALSILRRQLSDLEPGSTRAEPPPAEPATPSPPTPATEAGGTEASARTSPEGAADRPRTRRDRSTDSLAQRILRATAPTDDPAELRRRIEEQERQLESVRRENDEDQKSLANLRRWHRTFYGIKTVLPKTSETTDLLARYAIDKEDRDGVLRMIEERGGDSGAADVSRELTSRSIAWIVGTSMLFQALVIGLACWLFARRDF